MAGVLTYYSIKVLDSKNDVVKEIKRKRCNSYVKNFMLLLNAIFNKTYNSVVDTSGTEVNAGAKCSYSVSTGWLNSYSVVKTGTCYGGLLVGAGEGDDSYGIIVGSGTTEVTPDDYNLANKIAHGTADGQLYYYGTDILSPTVSGNTVIQSISREFVNQGSVEVTINEIGLVVNTSEDNYKVLIIRDVLDTPISVSPGDTVIIQIDIEITV